MKGRQMGREGRDEGKRKRNGVKNILGHENIAKVIHKDFFFLLLFF